MSEDNNLTYEKLLQVQQKLQPSVDQYYASLAGFNVVPDPMMPHDHFELRCGMGVYQRIVRATTRVK